MKKSNRIKSILLAVVFMSINLQATWQWATPLSSSSTSNEIVRNIITDNAGNQYINCSSWGDYQFGTTTFQVVNGNQFIAKLDAAGTLLWVKQAGNYSEESSNKAIALDPAGNLYVSGSFNQAITIGTTTLTSERANNFLLAKLDSEGNFVWVKKAAEGNLSFAGIAVDAQGTPFISGSFSHSSSDNDSTAVFGSTTLTSRGDHDIFIAKYSSAGDLNWVKQIGGNGRDLVGLSNADSAGNLCFIGNYGESTSFEGFTLTPQGVGAHRFLAKVNSNGELLFAKDISTQTGNWDENFWSFSIDRQNNYYIAGDFSTPITFGSTVLTPNIGLLEEIFVAKLDADGNYLWARQAGGIERDWAGSIIVDSLGNQYLTGTYRMQATFGSTTLSSTAGDGLYLTKIDTNGNFKWTIKADGGHANYGICLALGKNSDIYLGGQFRFNCQFEGSQVAISSDFGNSFVAKYREDGTEGDNINETKKAELSLNNYPNPFNPVTSINYELQSGNYTKLTVYNSKGELVKTLLDGVQAVGKYSVNFDGAGLNSGVYFYKLTTPEKSITQKMLLCK